VKGKGVVLALSTLLAVTICYALLNLGVREIYGEGTVAYVHAHQELQHAFFLLLSVLPAYVVGYAMKGEALVPAVITVVVALGAVFIFLWSLGTGGFLSKPVSLLITYITLAALAAHHAAALSKSRQS
jgi:hypothetical protein